MTAADEPLPDHQIVMPENRNNPVIFNSPHSGANYPPEFVASSQLSAWQLRLSEDCYVDELFENVTQMGCPMLKANFPRAYLDVNRAPWELDPEMFCDALPDYVQTSGIRVAGGLGTIPKKVSEKLEIYGKPMRFADARARVERYYFAYHHALQQLIDESLERFGTAILIDCHSMPSSAVESGRWRQKKADVVLGDRFGSSCDSQVCNFLEDLLDQAGIRTARNQPYAGGYITQTYGKPRKNVHAIQIEINRKTYMNETSLERSKGFEPLKSVLGVVMQEFIASFAHNDEAAIGLAAE